MKKFLGTRLATIIVTAIVTILAISTVAFASNAFAEPVPVSANVVVANPDIAVFSDVACTLPLTSIAFGDVVQGNTYTKDVYVKNVGNKAFSTITVSSNLDAAIGTLSSNGVLTLAVDASFKATVALTPKVGGASGAITPSLIFNSTY